jgi:glucokinase
MFARILSLDIGGSAIKSCVAEIASGEIHWGPSRMDLVKNPVFDALRHQIEVIATSVGHVDAVGISTAGSVDLNGQVIRAGYFSGYENVYWRNEFSQMGIAAPVVVVNDGQAAALAEYESLRETRIQNAIHFVIGTGIGGGAVVNGQLMRGEAGYAGAFGHIKVASGADAQPCRCGSEGCVQTVASVQSIVSRFNDEAGKPSVDRSSGGLIYKDPLRHLTDLDQAQTDCLTSVMSMAGYWLGRAIGTAINLFNPSVVTVGGGVIEGDKKLASSDSEFGPYLTAAFAEGSRSAIKASRRVARLRAGSLANEAGVRGAALLAKQVLDSSEPLT